MTSDGGLCIPAPPSDFPVSIFFAATSVSLSRSRSHALEIARELAELNRGELAELLQALSPPRIRVLRDHTLAKLLLGGFPDLSGVNSRIEIEAHDPSVAEWFLVPANHAAVLRRPAAPTARVEPEHFPRRHRDARDARELRRVVLVRRGHDRFARELRERLHDLVVAEHLTPRVGAVLIHFEPMREPDLRVWRKRVFCIFRIRVAAIFRDAERCEELVLRSVRTPDETSHEGN